LRANLVLFTSLYTDQAFTVTKL